MVKHKDAATPCERIGKRTIHTRYKSANTVVTVKSSFNGSEALEDLFFDIIKRKLEAQIK